MTTHSFIKQIRNDLFKTFPELELLKYKFDEESSTHFFLINESIYSLPAFAEFDYQININAMDNSEHGLICFITDESLFTFKNPKLYYNVFQNRTISKYLWNFIDQKSLTKENIQLEYSSSQIEENLSHSIPAGENTFALAA